MTPGPGTQSGRQYERHRITAAGAQLREAGRQFAKHAAILIRTVEQARQDAGIAQGYRGVLTVGARFALWTEVLLKWLPVMRDLAPDVSIHGEIGHEGALTWSTPATASPNP